VIQAPVGPVRCTGDRFPSAGGEYSLIQTFPLESRRGRHSQAWWWAAQGGPRSRAQLLRVTRRRRNGTASIGDQRQSLEPLLAEPLPTNGR
jgi:hypothetical protein